MADEQKKDDAIAPDRMHRFTWQTGDIAWDDEEEAKEEAVTVCQGPFQPRADDPQSGYCECCKQEYEGNLLHHACHKDEGEAPESGE